MRNRPFMLLGWLLICAGFTSLGAGWAGVQSTASVAVQLAYVASGGLVGIALVAMGTGLQGHDDIVAIRGLLEELRERYDDLENVVGGIQQELRQPPKPRVRSVK